MECINHPGTAAAGTCRQCGAALCASCFRRFEPPLCEPCLLAHNASVARGLYLAIGLTAAVFLITTVVVAYHVPTNKHMSWVPGLQIAGLYWGWRFLDRLRPEGTIVIRSIGLHYFIIFLKLFAVLLVGFLVMPWEIFKRVRELRAINALKRNIQAGKA